MRRERKPYFDVIPDAPPKSQSRIEFRVLRRVLSGYARGAISPDVREKLKSMGLIEEIGSGLVVTDQGLRRIELGK